MKSKRFKRFAAIGVVLALGGIGFGMCQVTRWRLRAQAGVPLTAVFVEDTLVVIDKVAVGGGNGKSATAKGVRLTAIDLATGSELATDVTDYTWCFGVAKRLWCVDAGERLHALDPRTLDHTAAAAELVASAKLAKATRVFEIGGDYVAVKLEDGRGARISSELAVTPVEQVNWINTQMMRDRSTSCAGGSRSGTYVLESGDRARLTTDPPPPAESATPSGPALTFLEGSFVTVTAPVIVHREVIGGPHSLSRVDGLTKIGWTTALAGECRTATVRGDVAIVTTSSPKARALAVDLGTGAVRWSFGR
ncbi:MAG: hypothetical protein ABI867_36900 [Kofleriaceae bacterium]